MLGRMHDIVTRRDCVLPLLTAPLNQVAQPFLADIRVQYPHIFALHSFPRTFSSPPAVIVAGAVCESPHPFATSPPTSPAPTMAHLLQEETKRIVTQFDYTDDDVNRGVLEFLRQMSMINDATYPVYKCLILGTDYFSNRRRIAERWHQYKPNPDLCYRCTQRYREGIMRLKYLH